jgi:hypothetical protein
VGTTTRADTLRLKADLELRLGLSKDPANTIISILAEGGVVYVPFTDSTDEKIVGRNGNTLSENSYSLAGSQVDYFGGTGFEFGKAGNVKLRVLGGYETGKGAYGKVGVAIPLSKN